MPLVRYRKVVILGYRSVGKTSLAHQFVEGEFLEDYDPTVDNTYSKIVTLGKDEFHLHLADRAGQDEYSILPYSFIIGVHGYVLVYSVTSLHSFHVIENLYQKLHEGHGKTRLPVVLVGNKADLSPDREVQAIEGKKLAESWGATFMESSARENQVMDLKIGKMVGVAVFFLTEVLGGEDGGAGGIPLRIELGGTIVNELTFFVLNLYPMQLTQGIFTKVIQEIARVENSYGQGRRCRLM